MYSENIQNSNQGNGFQTNQFNNQQGRQNNSQFSGNKKPCFNFQNGKCTRGDQCNFSHDTQQQNVQQQQQQGQKQNNKVCFNFQKGNCTRGDQCNFSHEIQQQNQQQQQQQQGQRQNKKICFNFQKGNCTRGDQCNFSHENQQNSQNQPFQQQQQQQQFNQLNQPQQQQQQQGQQQNLCRMFQNGNCKFGDKCRNSHGQQVNNNINQQGCQFKLNWGECHCDNDSQHNWSKDGRINLNRHFENSDDPIKHILKIDNPNTIALVCNSKIQITQFERLQDGLLQPNLIIQNDYYQQNGMNILYAESHGNFILTSTKIGQNSLFGIGIWDMKNNTNLNIQDAHQKAITGLYIQDTTILSSSLDGTIKVWQYDQNQQKFILDSQTTKQLSNDQFKQISAMQVINVQGNMVILAGVTDMEDMAGICVIQLSPQIQQLGIITTSEINMANSVLQIQSISEDQYLINVLHQKKNNNQQQQFQQQQQQQQNQYDFSQIYIISLNQGQGSPIFKQQIQDNNQKFSHHAAKKYIINCMEYQQNINKENDLILIASNDGSIQFLENKKGERQTVESKAYNKCHFKNDITSVAIMNFEVNAIDFFYTFIVDDKGHFSIWSYVSQ